MLNRNSTSKIKQSQADLVFAKFMDCSKRTISPRAAFISCQLTCITKSSSLSNPPGTCPAATRPNRKPFMVAHEQECQMWKQSLSASTRFIFSIVLQVQFKCARRDPFTWPRLPRRDSSIYCSLYCISTVIVVPCTHGVTNFERLEFGASSFVDVYASRASYTI